MVLREKPLATVGLIIALVVVSLIASFMTPPLTSFISKRCSGRMVECWFSGSRRVGLSRVAKWMRYSGVLLCSGRGSSSGSSCSEVSSGYIGKTKMMKRGEKVPFAIMLILLLHN